MRCCCMPYVSMLHVVVDFIAAAFAVVGLVVVVAVAVGRC